MKILLLNPPGAKLYTRDYYCGDEAKGFYSWPPTDLLYLSAKLSAHEVLVIDAIVENLSPAQTHKEIVAFAPELILSLCSSVSFDEDICFLKEIQEATKARLFLSGDYPRTQYSELFLKHHFVEAVVVNFAINNLDEFLQGEVPLNIVTRETDTEFQEKYIDGFITGTPLFEKFKLKLYSMPLIEDGPFSTFITEFGCKYTCTFCFYEKTKYAARDLLDIEKELIKLKELGVNNLFINDPSFYSSVERGREVCQLISKTHEKLSYLCGMRVDNINEEIIKNLKDSGCYAIAFGVESSKKDTQKDIRKNLKDDDIQKAFKLCDTYSIKTLAHFILGLSGETYQDQKDNIDYAIKLDPNFATFNVATPVWDTSFRNNLVASGDFANEISVNISDDKFVWNNKDISNLQIKELKDYAFQKFYLRPSYIFRYLFSIKNFFQLKVLINELKSRVLS